MMNTGKPASNSYQQITIEAYLDFINKPHPVDIRGLCDDAYCPECHGPLDDLKILDCERCPWCGLRIDWTPWHRFNDEEDINEGP